MKQHNIQIKDTLGNYITLNKREAVELHDKIISEHKLLYVRDALFDFYCSNTQINNPISVTKYQLLFLIGLLQMDKFD
jgi:hypothetical protein